MMKMLNINLLKILRILLIFIYSYNYKHENNIMLTNEPIFNFKLL